MSIEETCRQLKEEIDSNYKAEKNIKRTGVRADREDLEIALSFFFNKKITLPEPKVDFNLFNQKQ